MVVLVDPLLTGRLQPFSHFHEVVAVIVVRNELELVFFDLGICSFVVKCTLGVRVDIGEQSVSVSFQRDPVLVQNWVAVLVLALPHQSKGLYYNSRT